MSSDDFKHALTFANCVTYRECDAADFGDGKLRQFEASMVHFQLYFSPFSRFLLAKRSPCIAIGPEPLRILIRRCEKTSCR